MWLFWLRKDIFVHRPTSEWPVQGHCSASTHLGVAGARTLFCIDPLRSGRRKDIVVRGPTSEWPVPLAQSYQAGKLLFLSKCTTLLPCCYPTPFERLEHTGRPWSPKTLTTPRGRGKKNVPQRASGAEYVGKQCRMN